MREFIFLRLFAFLTGGAFFPLPVIKAQNIPYLMMKVQTVRSARDARIAHHRAGMRAQMVGLSTRYRGRR